MSQPGSAGLNTHRRNPRRAAATRHNGISTRPRAPNDRVTRSTARLRSDTDTDQNASSDSSDLEDYDGDDSAGEDYVRPHILRSRPLQTVASTRERRHQPSHGSSSRINSAFTVTKAGHTGRAGRSSQKAPSTSSPQKKAKPVATIGRVRKQFPKSSVDLPAWPTSKVIPSWQLLEWTIMVQVFEYAAYPLDNKTNVRWLLSAGLTCKAFLGPALKALYKCPMPQIISANMANKFASLIRELAADPSSALERGDHRRTMVESLVVNATSLPLSQSRSFDVAELIPSLPNLSYVELYHEYDLPPYRKLDVKATKKWTYTPELLNAIKFAGDSETSLRLRAWKWSDRMMATDFLGELKEIHSWATFSKLRKLSFVNFQVPSLKHNRDPSDPDVFEEDKNYIGLVAASLESVPDLKHLVMESSTVVDGQFLSLLPKTIEHLEIVNCWELTSEMLSEYLLTHGRNIRRLTLNHNLSLNLSFLPLLAQCCPDLRELYIDLLTFSHHEYYNDKDPIYDTLMAVNDVPAWPVTLEVIDLEQLAKWDMETAEMFFQSFVDQARNLPKLRYLAVKAMLDVPWRQRSEFRDKWVSKLKRVFLRKATKPKPYHSLIQWPSFGEDSILPEVQHPESAESEALPARRSKRIATHVVVPTPPASKDTNNQRKRKRTLTSTRDLRQRKQANISYRDPDTDEDLDLYGSEESDDEDPLASQGQSLLSALPASPSPAAVDEPFIHGLCDIVNIRFDNQKPREFQWGIEDFLDEDTNEVDDGEWTSDERDDESDNYAW